MGCAERLGYSMLVLGTLSSLQHSRALDMAYAILDSHSRACRPQAMDCMHMRST